MGRSVFSLIGVLVLFVVGCVGFFTLMSGGFYASPDFSVTTNKFFTDANNDKLDEAKMLLSSEYLKTFADNDFEDFIDQNHLDLVESASWNQKTILNENGTLIGSVKIASGVEIPLTIEMTREQGEWKINGIQLSRIEVAPRSDDDVNSNISAVKSLNEPEVNESPIPTGLLAQREKETPTPHESEVTERENTVPTKTVSTSGPGINQVGVLTINDIPNDEQAADLVKHWTIEFCKGVAENDFSELHSQFDPQFQEKISLKKFTAIFQEFIDRKLDLSWVKGVEPVFERNPSLDVDGVLDLVGSFPAAPNVNFNYSFVKNDDSWKPIAINLQIPVNDNGISMPSSKLIKEQVSTTTRKFGLAVADRDFSTFYRNTYSKFQEKFTIQQFRDYFGAFVENDADLSWLAGIEPVFDSPPTINLDGFLRVEGHFPSDPIVNFRYAFVKENGVWKVSTVNLVIPPEDESDPDSSAK